MKTIASMLLALSVLAGLSGRGVAQGPDDPSPNDTKNFYQQLDREGRGGQGQN
jgi:hypothetical protein